MAKKQGWVTDISSDGWAQVVIERGDACNHCEASQFCHALSNCTKMKTTVLNKAGANVGDLVAIQLSSSKILKGAVILYLVPTIGLLIGAVSGTGLSESMNMNETGLSIAFAFAGLALGFTITAIISRRMHSKKKITPVITRIIHHPVQRT